MSSGYSTRDCCDKCQKPACPGDCEPTGCYTCQKNPCACAPAPAPAAAVATQCTEEIGCHCARCRGLAKGSGRFLLEAGGTGHTHTVVLVDGAGESSEDAGVDGAGEDAGHTHKVVAGVVQEAAGHTHRLKPVKQVRSGVSAALPISGEITSTGVFGATRGGVFHASHGYGTF